MNALYLSVALLCCFLAFQVGCGAAPIASSGSCIARDESSAPALRMCTEYDAATEIDQDLCEYSGGAWANSPCDATQFARKCVEAPSQAARESETPHLSYVYYFDTQSQMHCPGVESRL